MEYKKPEIKLLAHSRGSEIEASPDEISAYSARACFTKESAYEILKNKLEWSKKQIYKNNKEKYSSWEDVNDEDAKEYFNKGIDSVMKNSSGRGHTSVLDQSSFTFNIVNLPRATTLHLCLPHYLMHLQQSLRRASADRGFYLPEEILNSDLKEKTEKILNNSFKLYEELVENNVHIEDARYILPLYTKTTITTAGNIRELLNLQLITEQGDLPSVTKYTINQMIKLAKDKAPYMFKEYEFEKEGKIFKGLNKEIKALYPSQQLFASDNSIINKIINENNEPLDPTYFEYQFNEDELEKGLNEKNGAYLSLFKHIHNLDNQIKGFLVPLSLAANHQFIRERTIEGASESIYSAARRKKIVIPLTILSSDLKEKYIQQNKDMFELYEELVDSGITESEAIGVIPHSLQIYNIAHVNAWNATSGFIPKRYCIQSQWEIRAIASSIVKLFNEKNPLLAKHMLPRGEVWGVCPEFKPCSLRQAKGECPRAPEVNKNIFYDLK